MPPSSWVPGCNQLGGKDNLLKLPSTGRSITSRTNGKAGTSSNSKCQNKKRGDVVGSQEGKTKLDVDVSKNRGTPKSSILIGFSIIFTIHFAIPLFLETPMLTFWTQRTPFASCFSPWFLVGHFLLGPRSVMTWSIWFGPVSVKCRLVPETTQISMDGNGETTIFNVNIWFIIQFKQKQTINHLVGGFNPSE